MFRTFERHGLFPDHPPDARFAKKEKDGTWTVERPKFGRCDFIVSGGGCCCGVELKHAGDREGKRFAFSQWEEHQRKWARNWMEKYGNPFYLLLVFGGDVDDKKWPAFSVLIPHDDYIEIESNILLVEERKSMTYAYADTLDQYKLKHATGQDRWIVPEKHIFWSEFRGWGAK